MIKRDHLVSNRTFALTLIAACGLGGTAVAQTAPALAPDIDCWMPRFEVGMKNPLVTPMRQALITAEQIIKANQTFMTQMPERVRMQVSTNGEDGTLGITVSAYPRQVGQAPYWTSTGCDIVTPHRSTRAYEHPLGEISVNFNRRGLWRADYFMQSGLKPVRVVAGFPVFAYRFSALAVRAELLIITKDGRLPVVPVTLADRLDREAAFLAKRLDEVRATLAQKPQAAVEAIKRQEQAELLRQVEALRAYRASFSTDELRAAWARSEGGPHSPEWRANEARVKALQALSPDDQAQVNALGARARALQMQARTRGVVPDEVARLRQEANELLNQANAVAIAQQQRVAAQVTALRNDFALKQIRPGDASQFADLKEDPVFFDDSDLSRIQLITVIVTARNSRETTLEQAKAWMAAVESSLDFQALKALIR
jgi:hypothetical protein